MKLHQGCMALLAVIGRFFKLDYPLTPEQRECCATFLTDDPIPETCLNGLDQCPLFRPPLDERGAIVEEGLGSIRMGMLALALTCAALGTWCYQNNLWMAGRDAVEAARSAVTSVRITLQEFLRSTFFQVFRKLGELAIVYAAYCFSGSHFDGSSWTVDHVYCTSPWKAAIASFILLVGQSGITQLKPNMVYVLLESLYADILLPFVLVCLGAMPLNDALMVRLMPIPWIQRQDMCSRWGDLMSGSH